MHFIFINLLKQLGGRATNRAMRATLEWEITQYKQVRDDLKKQGVIKSVRCRGGAVQLIEKENTIGA